MATYETEAANMATSSTTTYEGLDFGLDVDSDTWWQRYRQAEAWSRTRTVTTSSSDDSKSNLKRLASSDQLDHATQDCFVGQNTDDKKADSKFDTPMKGAMSKKEFCEQEWFKEGLAKQKLANAVANSKAGKAEV